MQFSQLNITQMQLKITHWTQRNSLRLWQLISKFIITMKRELREFLWIDRATRIVVVSMFKIIIALANGAKDKIYLVNFNPNKVKGATHLNRWTSPSTMPTSTSSVWASWSLSFPQQEESFARRGNFLSRLLFWDKHNNNNKDKVNLFCVSKLVFELY